MVLPKLERILHIAQTADYILFQPARDAYLNVSIKKTATCSPLIKEKWGEIMDGESRTDFNWYGVKLLYKITISGVPERNSIDEFFHDTKVFFEESILLVKAPSFDEAYKIAETTAQSNNEIYENKYGQKVNYEFYKSIDCFHLFDSPRSTIEVYSTYFLKKQNEDEQNLFDKRNNNCTVEELHLLRHL